MRRTIVLSSLALAVIFWAAPLAGQSPAQPSHSGMARHERRELRRDHRELRQDRHQLRGDRRELRRDRHELRHYRREQRWRNH